ncbi:SMI1/KNR4 family protein [Chitinibacter sp. FCG-7]|uniref:SMI1/KNR4 family protein n=1 Tax=Chitinibacter mangrovi TaxID=3153927 RepID=A0AAU7F7I5_9NEIS
MNISEMLENFNQRLVAELGEDEAASLQLHPSAPATEAQLAQLQGFSNLPIPAELLQLYRQLGGITFNDCEESYIEIFSPAELLSLLVNRSPKLPADSLGLIDTIRRSWAYDRKELDPEAYFDEDTLRSLNEDYKCFGIYREDLEAAYYFYFDKNGQFGEVYYHQDEFNVLECALSQMVDESAADNSLATLLEQGFEDLAAFHIDGKYRGW